MPTQPNKAPDGGPAFPHKPERREQVAESLFSVIPGDDPGMSLRDYFAIHASTEDIDPFILSDPVQQVRVNPDGTRSLFTAPLRRCTSEARYLFADSMLAARATGASRE